MSLLESCRELQAHAATPGFCVGAGVLSLVLYASAEEQAIVTVLQEDFARPRFRVDVDEA